MPAYPITAPVNSRQLVDDLEVAGVPNPLAELVAEAQDVEASTKTDLARQAIELAQVAQRVTDRLNGGFHINASGELQSQGPRFDQACVAYEAAIANGKLIRSRVAKSFPGAAHLLGR